MARPKKNAAQAQDTLLTLDTVPEIPVEEQPYPLPEGWKWIYLKNAYEVTSSKRIHKSDWRDSGIPFYRTRELVKLSDYGYVKNDLFIDEELYEAIKIKFGVPKVDDILISGVGTIGVPYIIKDDAKFYFKDGNIIWLKSKHIFIPKFLFYLFKSPFINKQIYDMSSGTTVDTYTIINANKTKLPLPPLEVQQCIVDRIESLFAKLDEAREKAESALESFERRKAAILHKAFTGELTRKWRELEKIDKSRWQKFSFKQLGEAKLGKMLDKQKNQGQLTPYLRNINIRWFSFDLSDIAKMLATEEDIMQFSIRKGDLFICEGGEPGRCAVWEDKEYRLIFQKALHRFRPNKLVLSTFLCFLLKYYTIKGDLEKFFTGTTIKHLTGRSLAKIPVLLPSLPEQQEIVRILDRIFAREQQAREAAENVLQRIDQMKKAILARAFRGELG